MSNNVNPQQLEQILSQFPQYYQDSARQFEIIKTEYTVWAVVLGSIFVLLMAIWIARFVYFKVSYGQFRYYYESADFFLIPTVNLVLIGIEIALVISLVNAHLNPHWQIVQQMMPQNN